MKQISIILLVIALLGLMVYTNPTLDGYDQFISQRITQAANKDKDPVAGVLGSLFGGLAANLMTKQTQRNDYVFFSTYDTALGNDHVRAIGMLNNFYLTEEPDFKANK
jgi:hypothetical protein